MQKVLLGFLLKPLWVSPAEAGLFAVPPGWGREQGLVQLHDTSPGSLLPSAASLGGQAGRPGDETSPHPSLQQVVFCSSLPLPTLL